MNDIGKELYERVRADFERRLAVEKHPPKDMRGVSDYSARVGRYLAEAIAANVTEDALPDRRLYYNIAESILEPSLRTNYELVNDTAAEVQRLLDERQGLRIKPARADYPEERVHAVIGAASEEGIEFGRALRRMTSPAENITQSFADDFMQANAAQRSRAGFDTFIERQGGLNCCPWCAGLVGVFAYPKGLPKEVFARHDNCTCSVTYGTKGGARQNAWTKAKWEVPPIEEPHRMTAEEAAEKGAFAEPKRLTGGANGGILSTALKLENFIEADPKKVVSNDCREKIIQVLKSQGFSFDYDDVRIVDIPPDKEGRYEAIRTNAVATPSYPIVYLELNKRVFSGKTLEEIDEVFSQQNYCTANSLEEAIIHECGHLRVLKNKTYAAYARIDETLKGSEFTSPIPERKDKKSLKDLAGTISPYAQKDGLECIAESEVVLFRGEELSDELKKLYDKYTS